MTGEEERKSIRAHSRSKRQGLTLTLTLPSVAGGHGSGGAGGGSLRIPALLPSELPELPELN
ncbi:hypothetical protein N7481_004844 [Penicillium waksmanii]|uniref:uncharacterized protein n=1 Tax=Penicillium waksmanii TaxID=69791 RepID=UPI0025478512|nr:uncharacterized protein N7481_004844 [Penicillium waksmanii]KAJ5989634.1 hypothetical protein N7481_004844 [Penicillium waksmanii]